MKELKTAKFCTKSYINSNLIFYAFYISISLAFMILLRGNKADTSFQATEFATLIYILVLSISIFKENFNFTLCNNISRKAFFKGICISILPLAAVNSLINLILARIFNLFVNSITIYEMVYTKGFDGNSFYNYVPNNSIEELFKIWLFQTVVIALVFTIGTLIGAIAYKVNKVGKALIPITIVVGINVFTGFLATSQSAFNIFMKFWKTIMGLNTYNVYPAVLSIFIFTSILLVIAYLVLRRQSIKTA